MSELDRDKIERLRTQKLRAIVDSLGFPPASDEERQAALLALLDAAAVVYVVCHNLPEHGNWLHEDFSRAAMAGMDRRRRRTLKEARE